MNYLSSIFVKMAIIVLKPWFTKSLLTDKKGRKIAIQIPIKTYEKLVADSEELEDIKEYHKAKTFKSDPILFDLALSEIEAKKWNIPFF